MLPMKQSSKSMITSTLKYSYVEAIFKMVGGNRTEFPGLLAASKVNYGHQKSLRNWLLVRPRQEEISLKIIQVSDKSDDAIRVRKSITV